MESLPIVLQVLLKSRKFWLALAAIIQTVIFALWPNFPPAIWQAIDTIIGILIAAIAAEDIAQKASGTPAKQ